MTYTITTVVATELTLHPLAELFPPMSDDDYQALKADIARRGQLNPLTVHDGQVLDGRHRWHACCELGILCHVRDLAAGVDPVDYVVAQNLHRRHLTESQRSMVAGKLATLKRGRPSEENGPIGRFSIDDAAKLLSVGTTGVKRAKQVIEHGSPAIVDAVESGELPVSFAAKFVTEEPDKKTQTELFCKGREAMREHIAEPSPYVDPDEESRDSAVKTLQKLWKKWDDVQRAAVRVWIDENYLNR
jgi:ParB-like chromosome segregation protein Spo0J